MFVKIQMVCWEKIKETKFAEDKEYEISFEAEEKSASVNLDFLSVLSGTLNAAGFPVHFASLEMCADNSEAYLQCTKDASWVRHITKDYIEGLLNNLPLGNSRKVNFNTLQISRIIRQEPVKRQPVL